MSCRRPQGVCQSGQAATLARRQRDLGRAELSNLAAIESLRRRAETIVPPKRARGTARLIKIERERGRVRERLGARRPANSFRSLGRLFIDFPYLSSALELDHFCIIARGRPRFGMLLTTNGQPTTRTSRPAGGRAGPAALQPSSSWLLLLLSWLFSPALSVRALRLNAPLGGPPGARITRLGSWRRRTAAA
jgi:hypothetical protein